jgi:hypothetical protein
MLFVNPPGRLFLQMKLFQTSGGPIDGNSAYWDNNPNAPGAVRRLLPGRFRQVREAADDSLRAPD